MKKANTYKGRKVLVEVGEKGTDCYTSKEMNIIRSFESFKNDLENEFWDNITLLEDNLTLFHCDIRKVDGDVKLLYDIRKLWEKGHYDYRDFYTKSEIEKLLEDNYYVAVEGLQEIDENDLEKLI